MSDLEKYLTSLRTKIAIHGGVVQVVGPFGDTPQFHYTVGLYPQVGFEIIAFGMTYADGSDVVNTLAERVQDGTPFVSGQSLTDVLEGGDVITVLPVPDARAWAKLAALLYTSASTPLPAWQIVHPDAAHTMPWEPGYAGVHQPLLAQPPQQSPPATT